MTPGTLRHAAGFTLVETLLAITLFTIVISSSYGIFSMGIQIWKRSQGRSLVETKAVLALERMGQDIRNTIKVIPESEAGLSKETFEYQGESASFEFPAAMVPVTDKYGKTVYQSGSVSYQWNSKGELCRAVKGATDLFLKRVPACRVLASEIRQLKFKYLLYDSFSKSASWYDSWEIDEGLPQAVQVVFEITPKLKNEKTGTSKKYQRTFLIPAAETINETVPDTPPAAV